MLRLLVVAAISLAPVATASSPCLMGASDDGDRLRMHSHRESDVTQDSSHESSVADTGDASVEGVGASPKSEDHGHAGVGACVADCSTHFQVPTVVAIGPTIANSARTLLAWVIAPSAPTAAIEHVPLV